MRILVVIDGLHGGGAEKVVLTLCEGMQAAGHDVRLVLLTAVCTYPIPQGIRYEVVADNSHTPWRKLTELSRRAAALDQVIANMERNNGAFDLAFSHLHKTDRIVRRSQILGSDRLWFCIHGILSTSYLGHRAGLGCYLKKHKIASVYQRKNVVAVSVAVSEDLHKQFRMRPHRLVVINNPFDIVAIQEQAAEPCELAFQDYLVHVGRFHRHKRHDRLLKAYVQSGIQVPLVLIGSGSTANIDAVKRLAEALGISQRVRLLGFQSNPYKFMRHASLLVLSSDSEGFGNVLVEALLCNTPVVSTRCPGGVTEILEKAGMEHVLSELNEYSLAHKMAQIYANPPEINHQKLLRYGVELVCRQYLSLHR
ncbi:Glycosyltransferase group 1 family protein [Serratia symbiotica]|nr:Glycosyltransferase group 1 family protein [Serratia symbiotica]